MGRGRGGKGGKGGRGGAASCSVSDASELTHACGNALAGFVRKGQRRPQRRRLESRRAAAARDGPPARDVAHRERAGLTHIPHHPRPTQRTARHSARHMRLPIRLGLWPWPRDWPVFWQPLPADERSGWASCNSCEFSRARPCRQPTGCAQRARPTWWPCRQPTAWHAHRQPRARARPPPRSTVRQGGEELDVLAPSYSSAACCNTMSLSSPMVVESFTSCTNGGTQAR